MVKVLSLVEVLQKPFTREGLADIATLGLLNVGKSPGEKVAEVGRQLQKTAGDLGDAQIKGLFGRVRGEGLNTLFGRIAQDASGYLSYWKDFGRNLIGADRLNLDSLGGAGPAGSPPKLAPSPLMNSSEAYKIVGGDINQRGGAAGRDVPSLLQQINTGIREVKALGGNLLGVLQANGIGIVQPNG